MAECGKGWTERCAHAKSKKCTCRCGGANHGKAIQKLDERGKHFPEIGEVLDLVVETTIRPLAFVPRVIERFDFEGLHGRRAETHLSICGRVAIATELEDNPGASITNAAENLWAKVREQFGNDIVTIEHYRAGRYSDGRHQLGDLGAGNLQRGLKEEWDLVTIVDGTAQWMPVSREIVADLIAGRPIPEALSRADDDPLGDDEDEDDLADCAPEGKVFYPGDEKELNAALDAHLTRTPEA